MRDQKVKCPECGKPMKPQNLRIMVEGYLQDEKLRFLCENQDCEVAVRSAKDLKLED